MRVQTTSVPSQQHTWQDALGYTAWSMSTAQRPNCMRPYSYRPICYIQLWHSTDFLTVTKNALLKYPFLRRMLLLLSEPAAISKIQLCTIHSKFGVGLCWQISSIIMAMCQWTVATSNQILQLNWLETLAGYEYHCFVTYWDWYVFYNGIRSLRPSTFGRLLGRPVAATGSVLKGLKLFNLS